MNCKQCGTELLTKREDARFCNGNCKQKHYKRRKKILDRIAQCERAIKNEENIIEHWNGVLVEASGKLKKRIASIELEKEKLKLDLIEYNETLAFSDKALFLFLKTHFENDADKFDHYLSIFRYGTRDEKFNLLNQYRQHFKEQIASFKDRLNLLEIESLIKGLQSLNKDKSEEEKEVEARLKKSRHTLSELKQELEKLSEIDLERIPVIPSYQHPTKLKAVSSAKAYTGREIADINFNAVQLNGALGRFCGKMERNKCAVALTGDSGAGKSHFSYALADGFVDQNLNVGYFSLESGFNSKFKKFASKYKGNSLFRAFEEGSLEDVRTEAANFDCLIIDSFSKISTKATDFEELRQDFPNTYFIIIFQKTTDGKIRGGSSILFNSTATIDIRVNDDGERLAVMVKSRYDTENFIYSITEDQLIKENKLPL